MLAGCASGGQPAALTGSSWPGIAASDDTIYVAYGAQVYAVDPVTGHARWKFPEQPARGQTFYAPPAVSEDLLVVGDYLGTLYGVDPQTGEELWAFESQPRSRFIGGAVISERLVYAGTVAGNLYALDIDTGAEAWHFTADRDIWSTPLLSEGVLYFTTLDRHLYAVDAETGQQLWQYPEEDQPDPDVALGAMVGTPTLYDGIVYFGSFDNHVRALDTRAQVVRWSYETSNWVWSSPVLDEVTGSLIGGDLDGNVFALSPETGEPIWVFKTDGPVVGQPVLADRADGLRIVYVTSGDSKLYTLNAEDGTEVDTAFSVTAEFTQRFLFFPTGSSVRPIPVYASPILFDDMILIGVHQGNQPLIAYDRETLRQRWAFDPTADP